MVRASLLSLGCLGVAFAGASCLFQTPSPVYSKEKEDPSLKKGLSGRLAYETVDGAYRMDLKTLKPIAIADVDELHMLTNPAADGRLFGVRNDMMAKRHTLISIDGPKVTDLVQRKGDALWGIDFKVHPISEYGALTPDGARAIYMVDGVGTQFDGYYLDVGQLEVFEIKSKKARRLATGVMNQPITFVPSRNAVVASLAKDAQGRANPTVALIDLASGAATRICSGMSAYPDPEGKNLLVETQQGRFQWFSLKTKKPLGKAFQKYVVGALAGGKALIRDNPSPATKQIIERHGKGPRNTTSLKVFDPASGKVATLADGIPTHARIGFSP